MPGKTNKTKEIHALAPSKGAVCTCLHKLAAALAAQRGLFALVGASMQAGEIEAARIMTLRQTRAEGKFQSKVTCLQILSPFGRLASKIQFHAKIDVNYYKICKL